MKKATQFSKIKRIAYLEKTIHPAFPITPQAELMLAVILRAVADLFSKADHVRLSASRFLRGDIPHASICGVDPSWIKRKLKEQGFI